MSPRRSSVQSMVDLNRRNAARARRLGQAASRLGQPRRSNRDRSYYLVLEEKPTFISEVMAGLRTAAIIAALALFVILATVYGWFR